MGHFGPTQSLVVTCACAIYSSHGKKGFWGGAKASLEMLDRKKSLYRFS